MTSSQQHFVVRKRKRSPIACVLAAFPAAAYFESRYPKTRVRWIGIFVDMLLEAFLFE
jgi:hypothetical protein